MPHDMTNEVYRCRELTKESLPLHLLRFTNERDESASRYIKEGAISLGQCSDNSFGKTLRGKVRDKNKNYEVELIIDKDEALKEAICQCNYYQQNKLYKGPCEHMLAVRKKVNEKVNEKFKF